MNAKQKRLKRRKRIRELDRAGKAYAVIDGKVVEDVEVTGNTSSVRKRTPVTLDGQTLREVSENHPKERSVLDGEFEELFRIWASALNAVHSEGKKELMVKMGE